MLVVILLCISIHSCYIGSKVVVSLLAIHLGASPTTIGVIAALYGVAPLILGVHWDGCRTGLACGCRSWPAPAWSLPRC